MRRLLFFIWFLDVIAICSNLAILDILINVSNYILQYFDMFVFADYGQISSSS